MAISDDICLTGEWPTIQSAFGVIEFATSISVGILDLFVLLFTTFIINDVSVATNSFQVLQIKIGH